jgi:hypothetical protein
MRRGALPLVLVVLLAGCAAPISGPPDTAEPTDSATATETPTATITTTPQPVGVEYVVRAGTIPDAFESVTVTFQVVFVERAEDMGPCWRETFGGPYEPTITPIAPPSGECRRSESVTVDLTDLDGERSLGRLTAPGRFAAGHALIATNTTATYRNGTTVTGMRGASDKLVTTVEGRPSGQRRVTLSIEAYDDRPYDYWLVAEDEDAE